MVSLFLRVGHRLSRWLHKAKKTLPQKATGKA
jgi:hypothetical protein